MSEPPAAPSPRPFRFGEFDYDPRAGELRRSGLCVTLQEKPQRVLDVLLDHAGAVVTRDELRQRLWPADTFVDFDGGLNTAVNKLRSALGDSAESPHFIETVGRKGYRFIAAIEPALASAEPSAAAAAPLRHRRWLLVGGAVLLAGLVGWAGWRSGALGSSGRIRSVAVLPLATLSGDAEHDYLAEGLTEALITDLAAIQSLRVISRQSVMRFQGSQKPLPQIARELGVDAVVTGSVVRDGQHLRVSAQLLHAPSDRHLWAQSYERDASGLLALQKELAQTIAHEVRATLTPLERSRLDRAPSVDPQAYDLYLRGRYFFNRRPGNRAAGEDLRKAIDYLQQAVGRDPGFALGYAALAEAYVPLAVWGIVPSEEALPPMRANALRAAELDDTLAEAHNALAGWHVAEWDWAGAESEYRRAIALNPAYVVSRLWYSIFLIHMGRYEEAVDQTTRGLENDPFNLLLHGNRVLALLRLGRDDESRTVAAELIELEPKAATALAYISLRRGRTEEAIAQYDKLGEAEGAAFARAANGERAPLRALLEREQEAARRQYVSSLRFARLHAALGENERALACLEDAYRKREVALFRLKTYPEWDPLRSDPRFQDLLRRLKLD